MANNCCCQLREKLMSTHATRLATRANKVESGFKNMRFWCTDSLDGRVDGRSSRMKKYAVSKEYGFVWTEA